ncbi:unnamed protein product [Echinostoma caproni]|uniref:DUF1758 domain-containing protein n=1 Tax=Echinostoma caproni TaxID=27848 RepID=A0A183AJQ7_9TREM|nr:unnamed protein product [Echinostoma caproni]
MGVLPIRLIEPKGSKETYAFLDNGSDSTLLSCAAAETLSIEDPVTRIRATLLAGITCKTTSEVNFAVPSLDADHQLQVEKAYTLESLPIQVAYDPPETMNCWPHLKGIHFEKIQNNTVDLLIGTNTPEAQDQRIGTSRQPYALKTVIGWVLLGPARGERSSARSVNCLATERTMQSQITKLFEIKFVEDNQKDELANSQEDKLAPETVRSSATVVGNHFQLHLPWKKNWRDIPFYRYLAERRVNNLRVQLQRDPKLLCR